MTKLYGHVHALRNDGTERAYRTYIPDHVDRLRASLAKDPRVIAVVFVPQDQAPRGDQLQPGQAVLLGWPTCDVRRTVAATTPHPGFFASKRPCVHVAYVENDDQWSSAGTVIAVDDRLPVTVFDGVAGLVRFVRKLADTVLDGEDNGKGEPHESENDDLLSVVWDATREARVLLGEPEDREMPESAE